MAAKYFISLIALLLFSPLNSSAQEKLQIEGAITLSNSESDAPEPGTIRWTGIDFQGWTGSGWVSLTAGPCGGLYFVSDVDGNRYRIVAISDQCWMAENLRVEKYNDGTSIPNVTGATDWNTIATPAYSWYNDNMANANTYGALYNWYTVDTLSNGNKNVCPAGWHVASEQEFADLVTYLGGELTAGNQMKAAGNAYFLTDNEPATNLSGFTAIPGGYRSGTSFIEKGYYAQYWTTTATNATDAKFVDLEYDGEYAYISDQGKKRGNSLRCIKD